MDDIDSLESRIVVALDRIGRGLDLMGQAGGAVSEASPEVSELQEALEAERTANAQLEERVRAIKTKQETHISELEATVTRLKTALNAEEENAQRLKAVNDQLRSANQALREAHSTGVADAHLINKAMLAELEALRARRKSDRNEIEAVLSELQSAAGEVAHA